MVELQLQHKRAVVQTALLAQLFQAMQPPILAVEEVVVAIRGALMLVLALTAALAL